MELISNELMCIIPLILFTITFNSILIILTNSSQMSTFFEKKYLILIYENYSTRNFQAHFGLFIFATF